MSVSPAWLLALALAAGSNERSPSWLGEELPLPLSVRSPEDLGFKSLAERQYLIFNLLAAGKLAWDRGDYETAADRWEGLLRLESLPEPIDRQVRPLAIEARRRAGSAAKVPLPPSPPSPPPSLAPTVELPRPAPPAPTPAEPALAASASVFGHVAGGGGGVVWLTRADGKTPRPRAVHAVMLQEGKRFEPRVMAVPVGSTVSFRNEDEVFHNVFSLTRGSDFDLGLYGKGLFRDRKLDQPGPVQLLCNIHSSMQGWIYVVDSPWYTQASSDGSYRIGKVPPGDYVVHAWHETSTRPVERAATVTDKGAQVELAISGDLRRSTTVPDKYGNPRQVQLGY